MSDQTAQHVSGATQASEIVDEQIESTADRMPTVLDEGRIR